MSELISTCPNCKMKFYSNEVQGCLYPVKGTLTEEKLNISRESNMEAIKYPKHFWIDDRDNGDGYVVHEEVPVHVQGELIHVIEYDEYDKILDKLDKSFREQQEMKMQVRKMEAIVNIIESKDAERSKQQKEIFELLRNRDKQVQDLSSLLSECEATLETAHRAICNCLGQDFKYGTVCSNTLTKLRAAIRGEK